MLDNFILDVQYNKIILLGFLFLIEKPMQLNGFRLNFQQLLTTKDCKIMKTDSMFNETTYIHLKILPKPCKFYKSNAYNACDFRNTLDF